jgi:hypothetical protein
LKLTISHLHQKRLNYFNIKSNFFLESATKR